MTNRGCTAFKSPMEVLILLKCYHEGFVVSWVPHEEGLICKMGHLHFLHIYYFFTLKTIASKLVLVYSLLEWCFILFFFLFSAINCFTVKFINVLSV